MTDRYLIDGYNLAHVAGLLASRSGPQELEGARLKLLQQLADAHGLQAPEVTVVFDARRSRADARAEQHYRGLRGPFSAGYPSADDLTEELIRQQPAPHTLTVVSDDRRLREAARRRDCRVLSCPDYLEKMFQPPGPAQQMPVTEPEIADSPSEEEKRYWQEKFADLDSSSELRELRDDFDLFKDGSEGLSINFPMGGLRMFVSSREPEGAGNCHDG